jgi:uncharacterized protein
MRVTSLRVYPVKSLRGHDVADAWVEPWGLAGDRRWAVLTPDGKEVTARDHPQLLAIGAHAVDDGLRLTSAGHPDVNVTTPTEGRNHMSSWFGPTVEADPRAGRWLSAVIGFDVVLVHQGDPTDRPAEVKHGGLPGDHVSLADDAPILLTTDASLHRLDELVTETALERGEDRVGPLSMVRFRPNVVVDGAEPFAEDRWRGLRIGAVDFRFAEACDRCVLPTYDPETLERSHEPTRTLARHHAWSGKVWFGIRLIPVTTGLLRLGDPVSVTAVG